MPLLTDLDRSILKLSATPALLPEARALIHAAGAVQAGAITHAQALERLSHPTLASFNLPSPAGAELGAELARLTGDCPGCCDSCAFKLGTVPNQCSITLLDAMDCVGENVTFHCHSDGKPCRGWLQAANKAHPTDP